MSNFKIAVIKENKHKYCQEDMNMNKLNLDSLELDIEDYIEFKTVSDPNNMMETVVNILNMTTEHLGETSICYEDENYIYELCYLSNESTEVKNINFISSKLVDFKRRVIGNSVLIKSRINLDHSATPVDISLADLIYVYQRSHVHTGIMVKTEPNNSIEQTNFFFNPIDFLKPEEVKDFAYVEHEVFGKRILQMFFDKNSKDKLNKICSIIYGKPIYGKVIIGFRHTSEDMREIGYHYCDLDKTTFNKLLCILSDGYLKENINKEIKDETDALLEEIKDQNNLNKMQNQVTQQTPKIFKNFYTALVTQYSSYKNKYGDVYKEDTLEEIKKLQPVNLNK
jgi:hypothetical protein